MLDDIWLNISGIRAKNSLWYKCFTSERTLARIRRRKIWNLTLWFYSRFARKYAHVADLWSANEDAYEWCYFSRNSSVQLSWLKCTRMEKEEGKRRFLDTHLVVVSWAKNNASKFLVKTQKLRFFFPVCQKFAQEIFKKWFRFQF